MCKLLVESYRDRHIHNEVLSVYSSFNLNLCVSNNMLERQIEKYLYDQVTKRGGLCYKWTAPQQAGVPDRIVMLNCQIWFIELKSSTGKLSKLQKKTLDKIRLQGCNTMVINSKELVDNLVDYINGT